MNNKTSSIISIITLSVVSITCIISYFYWNDIINVIEEINGDPDTILLINLSKGIKLLSIDIKQLEDDYNNNINNDFKSKLSITYSDIDYIFSKLDGIRGDEVIKSKRKKLVEEMKCLSIKLDELIVKSKEKY